MIGQITEFIGKASQTRVLRGAKVEIDVELVDPKYPADVVPLTIRIVEDGVNIKLGTDEEGEVLNLSFFDSELRLSHMEFGDEDGADNDNEVIWLL